MSAASVIAPIASIPLRQRHILDYLLTAAHDVTTQDIAHLVDTSVRTIRRDLPEIEQFLRPYRLTLQKKAGTGLRLNGTVADREALRHDLPTSSIASIRPSDRQAWLACTLLAASEPVKLHALACDLQITITTVGHDLDSLEPWLASYHLSLQRKRGWGVTLEGHEEDRRNAIVDLFFAQFKEPARIALFDEEAGSAPTAADLLLRPAWLLIAADQFRTTACLLRQLEETHPLSLEPAERLEFCLHIALLLERVGSGRLCEPAATPAAALSDFVSATITALVSILEAELSTSLPAAEIDRLALLLRGAAEPLAIPEPELLPLVQHFLLECDTRVGAPISTDPTLLDGLLPHLTRALQRLRNRLPIRNPLLQEIRENYQTLFTSVRSAADRVFTVNPLPDTEIGFLVLHVGSALERRRHRRWRTLVVCSAGVGTSRMLASRLRTELPEINIADLLSWQDAARIDSRSYDLVLSTIPLDWPHDRYLVVSPLLQEQDVRKITAHLTRLAALPRESLHPILGTDLARTKLDHDQRQTLCIHNLLHEWRVHALPDHDGPLAALLPAICQPLVANGTLLDVGTIAAQLTARIGQSSLVIPDSRLAFLHARDAGIARASISLHRLARPLIVHGTVIDQCLFMLAPLKLHRVEVGVLSRVSSLLMEPATIEILARTDELASRDYLSRQLSSHICD